MPNRHVAIHPDSGLVKIEAVSQQKTVEQGKRLPAATESGQQGSAGRYPGVGQGVVEPTKTLGGETPRLAGGQPALLVQQHEFLEGALDLVRGRGQMKLDACPVSLTQPAAELRAPLPRKLLEVSVPAV